MSKSERIEHKIVGKGFTKREAREDAVSQAAELAENLEGVLNLNSRRGFDEVNIEPVKPSANVDKQEISKFVNEYSVVNEDNEVVQTNGGEDALFGKASQAISYAKSKAIELGESFWVNVAKVLAKDEDGIYAEVSPNECSEGSYTFTFVEAIEVADEVLEEAEASA